MYDLAVYALHQLYKYVRLVGSYQIATTGPAEAKLHWSGLLGTYYTRVLGCRGMLPQENFNTFRWLLRLFWVQNITTNLCFSCGMITGF